MFQEHETVVLARDIAKHGLKMGDVGAVVHVYPTGADYEVEFIAGDGRTLAVLTLPATAIRPRLGAEILHVRPIVPISDVTGDTMTAS